MKQKKNYTDATEDVSSAITEEEIIADFLPPPEELTRKRKWEEIFAYRESLSSKYKFTENDVNLEIDNIRKLNEKITQSPIVINNGNQIRETNRST